MQVGNKGLCSCVGGILYVVVIIVEMIQLGGFVWKSIIFLVCSQQSMRLCVELGLEG